MRSLLVCSILAVLWAQHSIAAERSLPPIIAENEPPNRMENHGVYAHAPKHAAPASCEHPLDDFLRDIAHEAKSFMVSPSLTAKQYSFVQDEIKKSSRTHLVAPGDGAIVVDSDGGFELVLTKGVGDAAKVCAIMPIPAVAVAGIVAADEPPQAATPPAVKSDPERPWL